MKKAFFAFLVIALSALPLASIGADKDTDRLENCGAVLDEIIRIPDNIPQDLMDKAECVIVIPSVLKAAFGVGGAYGRGAMTCRSGEHFTGKWGAPTMIAIEGGSFGFQLGGQATDFVMLVMNPRGANAILVQQGQTRRGCFGIGRTERPRCGSRNRCDPARGDAHLFAFPRAFRGHIARRVNAPPGQRRQRVRLRQKDPRRRYRSQRNGSDTSRGPKNGFASRSTLSQKHVGSEFVEIDRARHFIVACREFDFGALQFGLALAADRRLAHIRGIGYNRSSLELPATSFP